MRLDEIEPQMRVAYVPAHAHGDRNHPDVEYGTVSSKNEHVAFVKFDKQVEKLEWTGATAKACLAGDLVRATSWEDPALQKLLRTRA